MEGKIETKKVNKGVQGREAIYGKKNMTRRKAKWKQ